MEKFLEFIKSIFVPRKMAKHRYMSALISLIIFVLSIYVLRLPFVYNNNRTFSERKEAYNYQVLFEIEDSLAENKDNEEALVKLGNLGCAVNKGILECEGLGEEEVFKEEITVVSNGITKKLYIEVDLREDAKLEVFDLEDYPYVENEEVYLLKFIPTQVYFQAHQEGLNKKEIKHNGVQLYENRMYYQYYGVMPKLNLDRDEVESRSLGSFIAEEFVNAEILIINSQFEGYLFLVIVIVPVLLILMFWLVFRKNGKLTTFKEYYNIAAITSITVTLIAFAIGWFWQNIIENYLFLFMIYYIFVIYKINNAPDDVK
jgi:hypothetical protein